MIRVALADDQLLVRAGFRALLQAEDDLEVVGEASSGEELLALVRRDPVDVVLMDIRMPGGDGFWATEQIAADLAREGMTPRSARAIGTMFARQRIDYTVIALVIADMVLKPTGDDVFTLLLMAAVLVVVVVLVLRSTRASAAETA